MDAEGARPAASSGNQSDSWHTYLFRSNLALQRTPGDFGYPQRPGSASHRSLHGEISVIFGTRILWATPKLRFLESLLPATCRARYSRNSKPLQGPSVGNRIPDRQ